MDTLIEPTISNNVRSNDTNNNSNNGNNSNNNNINKGTVFSSILSLSNTIIGTGILSLPYTIANTGVPVGIALFVMSAYVTKLSLCLYIEVARIIAPNKYDLKISQLSEMINMPKLGVFINAVIVLNGFGTATSLLIASSDFILSLFKNLFSIDYTGFLIDKRFWITVELFIIIPLVFRKSLASLKFFSLFSIFSISYLTLSIIISHFTLSRGGEKPSDMDGPIVQPVIEPTSDLGKQILKKFMGISIIIFAYGCQQNIFPIYSELKPSKRSAIPKIILYAVFFCTVIYLFVGYCGYATFGENVESNILNNYDEADILINIARLAMAVYCTLTYAIQMHPCRESIKKEYINYKIRHQKDFGDITENESEEKTKLLIDPEQHNPNYGSTSGLDSAAHDDKGEAGTHSRSNSSNSSNRNLSYDYDDDDDDEFESQIDANDADDERSSDSHHIKHINIDILDNIVCPVNTNMTTINNYDSEALFNWVTIILVASSYLMAMIFDDFGTVLSLVGATSCTTLTFILPGYLYVKITRGVTFKRLQAITLIVLGVVIGVIGTIAALSI